MLVVPSMLTMTLMLFVVLFVVLLVMVFVMVNVIRQRHRTGGDASVRLGMDVIGSDLFAVHVDLLGLHNHTPWGYTAQEELLLEISLAGGLASRRSRLAALR
jgi:hypothetical protein